MKNLPIDEEKFRTKLATILMKTAYGGLHTFAVTPLINDVVRAAKECKVEEAVTEEETATTTSSLLEEAEEE